MHYGLFQCDRHSLITERHITFTPHDASKSWSSLEFSPSPFLDVPSCSSQKSSPSELHFVHTMAWTKPGSSRSLLRRDVCPGFLFELCHQQPVVKFCRETDALLPQWGCQYFWAPPNPPCARTTRNIVDFLYCYILYKCLFSSRKPVTMALLTWRRWATAQLCATRSMSPGLL